MSNIGSELINSLRDAALDNAINKVSGTRTSYEAMQRMAAGAKQTYDQIKDAFETYKNGLLEEMSAEEAAQDGHYKYLEDRLQLAQDNMDLINSKVEDSHKQFLQSWENALSKIQDNYMTAVREAARVLEESFTPLFNTFELLQSQYERQKALDDYYVDNYQRIHDLSALDREIMQAILDTDNLKSKGRLRELQKEINDLQETGIELSEYDLDILERKYQVELARQALEDAKDAKSLVRLTRNNNGNWSYVYTSDETEIEEAEQNYENAIRAMEQANEDYIENLEAQIVQVQQSAEQAMAALSPSDFDTAEQYYQAIQDIYNGAITTLNYLQDQLNNGFLNNKWLDPYIIDRYGKNNHELTEGWNDMTLAAITGINSLDDATGLAKDNLADMMNTLLDAFDEFSNKQEEVYQEAGTNIAQATEYFTEEMNDANEKSNEQLERTIFLAEKLTNAYSALADKVKDYRKDIYDATNDTEKFLTALRDFIKISGDLSQQIELILRILLIQKENLMK